MYAARKNTHSLSFSCFRCLNVSKYVLLLDHVSAGSFYPEYIFEVSVFQKTNLLAFFAWIASSPTLTFS